jgi:hypothetical protein
VLERQVTERREEDRARLFPGERAGRRNVLGDNHPDTLAARDEFAQLSAS